jgi:hypothetical protein
MSQTDTIIEEVKVQGESKNELESLYGSDLGAYLESTILEFQSQIKGAE